MSDAIDEILANNPEDIGNRWGTNEDLQRFKGLPGQVVCNKDDYYRLHIMDGETYGGKPVAFKDEIPSLDGSFKLTTYESNSSSISISPNVDSVIKLNLNSSQTSLTFTEELETEYKSLSIFLVFSGSNQLTFPSNVYLADNVSDDQLAFAEKMANNKQGDIALFKLVTLDGGATWLSRIVGYWSK